MTHVASLSSAVSQPRRSGRVGGWVEGERTDTPRLQIETHPAHPPTHPPTCPFVLLSTHPPTYLYLSIYIQRPNLLLLLLLLFPSCG